MGVLEKSGGSWIINTEVAEFEDEEIEAARYKRRNDVTQEHTAFDSFFALCTAQGGYRPSLRVAGGDDEQANADLLFLADEYDATQKRCNDDRRAFRYG